MSVNEYVEKTFTSLRPDIPAIYDSKKSKTIDALRKEEIAKATGSGAAAVAIPGLHLAGMAADVAFLMNRMSVAAYGVGAIKGYDHGFGNILEEEDFAIILGLWAGDEQVSAAISAKAAADLSTKVFTKAALKTLSKTMIKNVTFIVGKKMGTKMAAKVSAKFGAKLGGKVAAGFVPFLGAAVGGGINFYFISSICDAAEKFYDFKCSVGVGLE